MGLQKIIQYTGKVTFERGQSFYDRSRIITFQEYDNNIVAVIKGHKDEKFNVKITLDNNGDIIQSECSCPLWDRCKHIVAALIHHFNVSTDDRQPSSSDRIADGNEIFRINYDGTLGYEVGNMVQSLKPASKKETLDKREWKLYFRIKRTLEGGPPRNDWNISPVMRYVRKNGSLGSIYNYSSKKKIRRITQVEQSLLTRLLEHEDKSDKFIYYLDYFLDHPELKLLLISGYNYFQVFHYPIKKVSILFELESAAKEEFAFRPYLEIHFDSEEKISTKVFEYSKIKYGDGIYFIFENGLLLYKKGDHRFTDFLESLLDLKFVLYPVDIRYLKEYTKENFPDSMEVDFNIETIRVVNATPEPVVELYKDILGRTNIKLRFYYKDKETSLLKPNPLIILGNQNNETIAIRRSLQAEKRVVQFFEQLIKEEFTSQNFTSSIDYKVPVTFSYFLHEYGTRLIDNGFKIKIGDEKHLARGGGQFSLQLKTGIDWFDFQVTYREEDGTEKPITLSDSDIRSGIVQVEKKYVLLSKTDIELLKKIRSEGADLEGKLKVSRLNFNLLNDLSQNVTAQTPDNLRDLTQYKEIYNKLIDLKQLPQYPLPVKLNCKLRHYQQEGYYWLLYLYENRISGCLADDMGLGKTIQTLAMLQYLIEKGENETVLIVVPVTLLANWESEIRRYTPEITFLRHAGKNRTKDMKFILEYQVVLISYHTLRVDMELFAEHEFKMIILDESQNIKNAFTQSFKAIKALRSRHRLSLTGTPVENTTQELWSQLEFLNPGLLGSINHFKKRFAIPIEEHGDMAASEKLKRIISPFILRRKKEEVVEELPDKEVAVCYSEMNIFQREAYNYLRDFYRDQVKNVIKEKGVKKSRIEILDAVLRLRQMALFPGLVNPDYVHIDSCKFEMLKDMLDEILEEKHKVLIFSQFVEVLKIIKEYIEGKNLKYAYIDGSTKERREEIVKFQNDPDTMLFLLSLRAGGTGINLTAADYVLLYDPWWNPAVEKQAIDRAHRIGQKRKVLAYKMIVKNTIEEKILKLQEKKADLVDKIISEDRSVFRSLSEEDIMELFQ